MSNLSNIFPIFPKENAYLSVKKVFLKENVHTHA
jgi:hypothetical protein